MSHVRTMTREKGKRKKKKRNDFGALPRRALLRRRRRHVWEDLQPSDRLTSKKGRGKRRKREEKPHRACHAGRTKKGRSAAPGWRHPIKERGKKGDVHAIHSSSGSARMRGTHVTAGRRKKGGGGEGERKKRGARPVGLPCYSLPLRRRKRVVETGLPLGSKGGKRERRRGGRRKGRPVAPPRPPPPMPSTAGDRQKRKEKGERKNLARRASVLWCSVDVQQKGAFGNVAGRFSKGRKRKKTDGWRV